MVVVKRFSTPSSVYPPWSTAILVSYLINLTESPFRSSSVTTNSTTTFLPFCASCFFSHLLPGSQLSKTHPLFPYYVPTRLSFPGPRTQPTTTTRVVVSIWTERGPVEVLVQTLLYCPWVSSTSEMIWEWTPGVFELHFLSEVSLGVSKLDFKVCSQLTFVNKCYSID